MSEGVAHDFPVKILNEAAGMQIFENLISKPLLYQSFFGHCTEFDQADQTGSLTGGTALEFRQGDFDCGAAGRADPLFAQGGYLG